MAFPRSIYGILICTGVMTSLAGCSRPPTESAGQPRPAKAVGGGSSWFSLAPLPLPALNAPTDVTLDISETSGSGVAIADLNGDSRPDLVIPGTSGSRTRLGCSIILNSVDGWKAAEGTGIPQDQAWRNCAVGDLDGDGKPDLALSGLNLLAVFRNLGGGKFAPVASAFNQKDRWYTSITLFDVNGDGRLDCYAGAYVTFNKASPRFAVIGNEQATGERVVGAATALLYPEQRGKLFLNQGAWKFQDATAAWGLGDAAGRTLGAATADFNRDGHADLFLSNDRSPSELYLNEKGKGFRRLSSNQSPAYGRDGELLSLHGAAVADVNGDKLPDIVAGAGADQVTPLFIAAPGNRFEDEARLRGLIGTYRYTANGVALADFDGDAAPDLLLANGNWISTADRISSEPGVAQPLQLFRNVEGRFEAIASSAFPAEARRLNARGLAVADVNGDGRPDVLVNRLDGPAVLLLSVAQ